MLSAYTRLFFDITLLRAAPQDVPASKVLCVLVVALFFCLGVLKSLFAFDLMDALLFNGVELALLLAYMYLVLFYTRYSHRFLQTLISSTGVLIMFMLFDFPAYWLSAMNIVPMQDPLFLLMALYRFFLLIYNVFVIAYIFKHALSTNITLGVILSLGFFIADILIKSTLFPIQS